MSIKSQQLLPSGSRFHCQVIGQGLAALWNLDTLYLYSSKTGELVQPDCGEASFYSVGTTAIGGLVIPSVTGEVSVYAPDGRLRDRLRLRVRGHLLGAHQFSDGRFLAMSGDRYGGLDEPDSICLVDADGKLEKLIARNGPARAKMIVLPWDDVLIPEEGWLVREMDRLVGLGGNVVWTKAGQGSRKAVAVLYVSATGKKEITGHDADGMAVVADSIGSGDIAMMSAGPDNRVLIAADDGAIEIRSMQDLALILNGQVAAGSLALAQSHEDFGEWLPPPSALWLGPQHCLVARWGSANGLVLNSRLEIIDEIRIAEPDGIASIHALDEDNVMATGLNGGVELLSYVS